MTSPARWLGLAAALAAPAVARPATLTVDDPLISIAECTNRSAESVGLSWDLGSSSGSTVEILGSNASGCSETDATTAVLADGNATSQTSYPASGDAAITLADVLSAAGKTRAIARGPTSASTSASASSTRRARRSRPRPPGSRSSWSDPLRPSACRSGSGSRRST